jgi:hypothetical protein
MSGRKGMGHHGAATKEEAVREPVSSSVFKSKFV